MPIHDKFLETGFICPECGEQCEADVLAYLEHLLGHMGDPHWFATGKQSNGRAQYLAYSCWCGGYLGNNGYSNYQHTRQTLFEHLLNTPESIADHYICSKIAQL